MIESKYHQEHEFSAFSFWLDGLQHISFAQQLALMEMKEHLIM
jgi:hypothetical protein